MIIDAKLIPVLERAIFADLNAHGVTAVSVVCSIWEGPGDSRDNMTTLAQFVAANDDLLYQVRSVADIDRGSASGKTGVIFSWQNSSGFGDDLASVPEFAAVGLRIAQPTFITANSVGSGCNEPMDAGLTSYGLELVGALNESGIAIDLAHVGTRTAQDVVLASSAPVFYSQSSPRALYDSPRNKTDEEMRLVADRGGIICLTTLRQYLPAGLDSTVEDMAATVCYAINVVGEDSVALGSDLTPGQSREFFEFISHDGGNGLRMMDYTELPTLPGFEGFEGYENLRNALVANGLRSLAIDKFMGLNLRRFFSSAWGAASAGGNASLDRDRGRDG